MVLLIFSSRISHRSHALNPKWPCVHFRKNRRCVTNLVFLSGSVCHVLCNPPLAIYLFLKRTDVRSLIRYLGLELPEYIATGKGLKIF